MKKSNIVTAVICAVVLSATSFYSGYAASGSSGITYNSQGKIVFNNGTSSKTDDVVFDASDFTTIDNMVSSGKSNIVSELNKYSTTNISATNPTFSQLATAISNISAGTDATANHILSGKKALVGKNIVTGSHTCATLQAQTSDATATKADILSGKTAYVNGNKVTGSMPSKQVATYTPGTSDQTINGGQYLSGNQTIKGDSNLTGTNIVSGKSIFGVAGSHVCSSLQNQTSDATATDADILSGKTAYVNGVKKTGAMVNNGAVSKTLTVGDTYTIPQGYHNGAGVINVIEDSNLISENIKNGINIFGVTGTLTSSSSESITDVKVGKMDYEKNTVATIETGFKADIICLIKSTTGGSTRTFTYVKDYDPENTYYWALKQGSTEDFELRKQSINGTSQIYDINDNGFKYYVNNSGTSGELFWIALKTS